MVICNPTGRPTHTRGAALDLVIASPAVVESVHVHNPQCDCEDSNLCCPLLASDHFANEINLHKRLLSSVSQPPMQVRQVRDWEALIHAQAKHLQRWSDNLAILLSTTAHMSTEARRQQLDVSYRDFLKIVWDAEPGLYRCPRANAQRQPSWWNDDCFDAMVARNAAWRQRNRFPELDSNFRAARNHFYRVFRRAKTAFWSNWLQPVERMCPRANSCRVAPRCHQVRKLHHTNEMTVCTNRVNLFKKQAP